MTVLYLDSNALAKLYLNENLAEQRQVIALCEEYGRVASCTITYTEVSGVFARYFHTGVLSEEDYAEKMELFSGDWETVEQVNVTPGLSVLAGQLLKAQQGLRAMDALHLASALSVRAAEEIKFLTFDTLLQTVAGRLIPGAVA